jgi:hypothetical protein
MQEVAEEIIKYNVDIAAVQEIRWRGTGQICKMKTTPQRKRRCTMSKYKSRWIKHPNMT